MTYRRIDVEIVDVIAYVVADGKPQLLHLNLGPQIASEIGRHFCGKGGSVIHLSRTNMETSPQPPQLAAPSGATTN